MTVSRLNAGVSAMQAAATSYLWAMPRQACIFCERAQPLVTITKEHLFSRWVDQILTSELIGLDRSFERTTARPDGVVTSEIWPAEVVAVIEAPVVCGSSADGCNGG